MGLFKLGANKWGTKEGALLASADTPENNLAYTPFTVVRGSTGTYFDRAGILQTAGLNEPRIDFLGSANGHLLTEPQSTNILLWSNDFSNAVWTKSGIITVTPNDIISPDGTLNGSRVDGGDSVAHIRQTPTTLAGTVYAYSIFIKNINALNTHCFTAAGSIVLNWNGAILESITVNTALTSGFEDLGGGWYRAFMTYTETAPNNHFRIYPDQAVAGSIYLYGCQLEALTYKTSYIPTTTATVTRTADAVTDAGNSEVFNSSEGVLYAEIAGLFDTLTDRYISLSDGTLNNRVNIRFSSTSNTVQFTLVAGGATQADQLTAIYTLTEFNKFAISWKFNEFKIFVNGAQFGTTDISVNPPTVGTFDRLDFTRSDAIQDFYGKTKDIKVYPYAMTDAELIKLTT